MVETMSAEEMSRLSLLRRRAVRRATKRRRPSGLDRLVAAWPHLSEEQRDEILQRVDEMREGDKM